MLAFARIDACTVQEHIYGLAVQFVRKILHGLSIRDIQAMEHNFGMLRGKLLQGVALLRLPGSRQHLPTVSGVLTDKLKTQAAVGAGDQDGRHVYELLGSLWERASTLELPWTALGKLKLGASH